MLLTSTDYQQLEALIFIDTSPRAQCLLGAGASAAVGTERSRHQRWRHSYIALPLPTLDYPRSKGPTFMISSYAASIIIDQQIETHKAPQNPKLSCRGRKGAGTLVDQIETQKAPRTQK